MRSYGCDRRSETFVHGSVTGSDLGEHAKRSEHASTHTCSYPRLLAFVAVLRSIAANITRLLNLLQVVPYRSDSDSRDASRNGVHHSTEIDIILTSSQGLDVFGSTETFSMSWMISSPPTALPKILQKRASGKYRHTE